MTLSYADAKSMARILRAGLKARDIDIDHSTSLELVARQFGLANWNVLAARLAAGEGKTAESDVPRGWQVAGSAPQYYDMGAARDERGDRILIIRSAADTDSLHSERDFGTLMQSFSAADYLGRRIRLSAALKTTNVVGAATIWMRIDGRSGQHLGFDNMEKRTVDGVLTGTTGWIGRQIVLDVPDEAHSIHFGVYLRGKGAVGLRSVEFEAVSAEVDVTVPPATMMAGPTNLDFR